jgi:hypothetical protein
MHPKVQEAIEQFERDFRTTVEVVGGIHTVYKKFAAEFELHPELNAPVDEYALMLGVTKNPTQRARLMRELVDTMYQVMCQVFLRLRDRGAFEFPVTEIAPELAAEMKHMEIWAGVRERPAPSVIPPTAEELLAAQVAEDWEKLPTAKFKQKLNDKKYREAFERLTNSGDLKPSQAFGDYRTGHVGH